ncbi:MAG TPA: hypothetical protein VF043_39150 [Ktedonobacteraceae bacterium]
MHQHMSHDHVQEHTAIVIPMEDPSSTVCFWSAGSACLLVHPFLVRITTEINP